MFLTSFILLNARKTRKESSMGEELNILLNIEIVLLYLPTAVLIIGTIVVGIITSRFKRKDKFSW